MKTLSEKIGYASRWKDGKINKKDVKEFIKDLKEGNKTQLKSILTSILLWFLSDNIKVDEKRLKKIFEGYLKSGFVDKLAGKELVK